MIKSFKTLENGQLCTSPHINITNQDVIFIFILF